MPRSACRRPSRDSTTPPTRARPTAGPARGRRAACAVTTTHLPAGALVDQHPVRPDPPHGAATASRRRAAAAAPACPTAARSRSVTAQPADLAAGARLDLGRTLGLLQRLGLASRSANRPSHLTAAIVPRRSSTGATTSPPLTSDQACRSIQGKHKQMEGNRCSRGRGVAALALVGGDAGGAGRSAPGRPQRLVAGLAAPHAGSPGTGSTPRCAKLAVRPLWLVAAWLALGPAGRRRQPAARRWPVRWPTGVVPARAAARSCATCSPARPGWACCSPRWPPAPPARPDGGRGARPVAARRGTTAAAAPPVAARRAASAPSRPRAGPSTARPPAPHSRCRSAHVPRRRARPAVAPSVARRHGAPGDSLWLIAARRLGPARPPRPRSPPRGRAGTRPTGTSSATTRP